MQVCNIYYITWVAHTSVMCGWRQPQDVFRISLDFEKIFILQFRRKSSCAFSAHTTSCVGHPRLIAGCHALTRKGAGHAPVNHPPCSPLR